MATATVPNTSIPNTGLPLGGATLSASNPPASPMMTPLPANPTLPALPMTPVPTTKALPVVTPALATKNLNTVKTGTAAITDAMQAQNAANATRLNTPTKTTAVATPTQPTTPPAPTVATDPAATTKSEILALLKDGSDLKLTQEQVQQIAGTDFTGVHQNTDGTFSLDQSARDRIETANPSSQSADDRIAYGESQRAQLDKDAEDAAQEHVQQIQQLQNGTFPLSPEEQAQVTALQQQFENLKQLQLTANKNYEGAITTLGIRSGRSRYAPEIESGNIQQAISDGLIKVGNIEAQASKAVSDLKQAIQDKNYKAIDALYTATNDYLSKRKSTIDDIFQTVKDEADRIAAKEKAKKDALDNENAQISSIARAAFTTSLKADGTIDHAALQKTADSYKVDVNALYNAVLKEQQTHEVETRDATKFQSDQLAAEANLAKTKANTAEAYANIDKTKAEQAKLEAEANAETTPGYTTDENGNVIATGNYNALTIGRYNKAANAATSVLQKNPTFKNIIGSSAYLDRIEAAVKNPGSVGDQELLDAFTQLNTGGNRVTEAQVHLITNNQSLSDWFGKIGNKLSNGGALSAAQRNEIVDLSHEVYKNYQKSYKPLYDDAVKRLKEQGIPEQFWNIPNPDTLSRAVVETGSGSTTSDTTEITPELKTLATGKGYTPDQLQESINQYGIDQVSKYLNGK